MTDSNLKYRDHGGRPSQDDDPLMELSRIIGFDEPVKDAASQAAADDLSFDLEQELIGGLEAELHTEVQPDDQPTVAPAMHHNWSTPRHVEEPRAEETEAGNTGAFSSPSQSDDDEFDFSASLESELSLSMGKPDAADPAVEDFSLDDDAFAAGSRDHVHHTVADGGEAYSSAPALDSEEYSSDFSAAQDNDGYDPTIYEPAYDPAGDAPAAVASYVAAPSLEDELEMLLTGGDEVSPPAAPAAGYPAPQAEPAAVHYPYYPSRSYSSPAPIPGEHGVQPASYAASYSEGGAGAHEGYGAPSHEATADEMERADAAPNGWDGEEPQLDEDFFGAEDDGQYAEAEVPDLNDTDNAQSAQAMVYAGHSGYRIAAGGPAPEVETVIVSESRVDQTDALDLPEVDYEAEPAANSGLNALESEFAEVFTSIEVDDQTPAPETQAPAGNSFDDIFNDAYGVHGGVQDQAYGAQPLQTAAPAAYAAGAAAAVSGYMAERASQAAPQPVHSSASPASASPGTSNDYYNHWAGSGQGQEDFDYDPHSADDLDIPAAAYERQPARGRRGLVMASVAGAALLIGGLGYYAFSSGGGIATPVVIQADNQPVKVQPENPGGNTVPNQDKAVYDRVAGTTPDAPEQKTLVNTEEKPVDIGMADDDDGSFDDTAVNDRVEPSTLNGVVSNGGRENPVFAPRRVQTMVVKPDGTIVAQEAAPSPPASASVATPQARPAGTEIAALENTAALPARNNAADATEPTQTAGIPTQQPNSTPVANAPARVVNTQAITPDSAMAKPKNVPVVPSRPAQQPVTIVDSTPAASAQPTQVASAANAAGTAAASAGAYSIQIASQPSADAAQQSYANLARRYGNIIGGHGVDIRRADIAGKGTYYRVRINVGSKSDAVDLCTRYKSAGGSCFVTQ
ncbi:hypothetical protein C5748_22270 [Phyllobacterium phragmitis]|uniref:SPOR domain-containing protein n=1 Tax=Phyllobacterium phragmitis TaxID=2670329 RepID=A0A2S9IL57_9HYPH|nr:SPOR domain-containing protein [Phyllobacterium phragmitis]PRD41238.1 hypothetical protein C5748_22270 [Phyllobacterium phragmitis]